MFMQVRVRLLKEQFCPFHHSDFKLLLLRPRAPMLLRFQKFRVVLVVDFESILQSNGQVVRHYDLLDQFRVINLADDVGVIGVDHEIPLADGHGAQERFARLKCSQTAAASLLIKLSEDFKLATDGPQQAVYFALLLHPVELNVALVRPVRSKQATQNSGQSAGDYAK